MSKIEAVKIKSSCEDEGNADNHERIITVKLINSTRLENPLEPYSDDWWEWISLTIEEESGRWAKYNISVKAAFKLMLALDVLLGESLTYESLTDENEE